VGVSYVDVSWTAGGVGIKPDAKTYSVLTTRICEAPPAGIDILAEIFCW